MDGLKDDMMNEQMDDVKYAYVKINLEIRVMREEDTVENYAWLQ